MTMETLMIRQEDLQTNRDVRRILVRHWIDLGRLSIRTANGVVYVRGVLERLHNTQTPLNPASIEVIFTEIRRSKNVRRIHPELHNWVEQLGQWHPVHTGHSATRT